MSHSVMQPNSALESPGEKTLAVLQQKLNLAEDDAKHLSAQLSQMDFNPCHQGIPAHQQSGILTNTGRGNTQDPIPPFKARMAESESMYLNYDGVVSRVCKLESIIQSLKLNLTQVQAERDLSKKEKAAAHEKLAAAAEAFEKELKKMNRELTATKKDLKESVEMRQEAEESFKRLQQALEDSASHKMVAGMEVQQLQCQKQKLCRRVDELRGELHQEASLRGSLEEAHTSLLTRIRDMEALVENERSQVKTLNTNCSNLKKNSIMAREETQNELLLRQQLQKEMQKLLMEGDKLRHQVSTLEEDKALLMTEVRKMHKSYTDLNGQIDQMKKLVEDKQSTREQLEQENKQLHAAVKSSAASNAHIIAKYEQQLEGARVELGSVQRAEESIKQLEEQLKAECRDKAAAVLKCSELDERARDFEGRLSHQEVVLKKTSTAMDSELSALKDKLAAVTEERDRGIKDKENLLDEVNQAVDSMSEERGRLDQQIQELQVDLQSATQAKGAVEMENKKLIQKIASMDEQKDAQNHVEQTLGELTEQKNRLAYDRGRLQARVDTLQGQVEELSGARGELGSLSKAKVALEAKLTKMQAELSNSQLTVQRLESQIRQVQNTGDRKEKDFTLAIQARDEACREAQKLLGHIEAMEEKHKHKVRSLEQDVEGAHEERRKLGATLEAVMGAHSQLQSSLEGLQEELGRRDVSCSQLQQEKQELAAQLRRCVRESDVLQEKLASLETLEHTELQPLRSSLSRHRDDNTKLATNMQVLMEAHSKLQGTAEALEDKVQKKTHLAEKIQAAREQDAVAHKDEVRVWEERLDSVKQQLGRERDKTTKRSNRELAEVRRQLEEALGKNGDLARTNTDLRHKATELEMSVKDGKDKSGSLRGQVEHLQRVRGQLERRLEGLQLVEQQLQQLEDTKSEYIRKNKEQAKTIHQFMAQIAGLQAEVKTLAKSHLDTSELIQKQEETLAKERTHNSKLQSKFKECRSREQQLEQLRQRTEEKLREANDESFQYAASLKDAHEWFKAKFDSLQGELHRAQRTKSDVERDSDDARSLLEEEKRQAEELSTRARHMIRSSRDTISRLADYAEHAQGETAVRLRDMKSELDQERDRARLTEEKLQYFQNSSMRHTEELARELDYYKNHSIGTTSSFDTS